MNEPPAPFAYYMHDSQSVRQGPITITPRSQVIGLRLPFLTLIWNRPVGVKIYDLRDHSHDYQPIADVTRYIQWGLYALVLLVWLLNLKKLSRRQHAPAAHRQTNENGAPAS